MMIGLTIAGFVPIAALVIWAMLSLQKARDEYRLPQDTYSVTGPHGERLITGYLQSLPDGILVFKTPEGKIAESYGPGGWWRAIKVGEGGES